MAAKRPTRKRKIDGTGSGGGKAAFGGPRYQAEVAAFFSVHMLAEHAGVPVWELPPETTVVAVRCETEQAVDDVLPLLANGGFLYLQAKRTLSLSDKADSPLRSAVDQFTRQYLHATGLTGTGVWDRRLDTRDRFVLVTRSASGTPMCETAAGVLDRLRDPVQPASAAARTKEEEHALAVLTGHVQAAWKDATRKDATAEDIRRVLAYVHIETLDTAPAEQHSREARKRLRDDVLVDPTQDEVAWKIVTYAAETASAGQSGLTRAALETLLTADRIRLKQLRSYEHDVEALRRRSEHSRSILADFAALPVAPKPEHIPRSAAVPLALAADAASLLVIGEPGAGKSGALHDLYVQLRDAGRSVILLIADDLNAPSVSALQTDLQVEHDVLDVLRNWRSVEPGVLIVDALDSQRSSGTGTTLRHVIAAIQREQLNWRVVASIRTFDLRRGVELQKLFRGGLPSTVPQEFQEPEFREYRHFLVPRLTDDELAHVARAVPALGEVIASAPPQLKALLRVLFNLSLLAQLLDIGAGASDLANIRTQLDLLDLYWDRRVIRDGAGALTREDTLRRICETMIARRRLRIPRLAAVDASHDDALQELLREHVLAEPVNEAGSPDGTEVAFAHHVLFDYATAHLICRRQADDFAALLTNRSLPLVIWASLMMHFHHEWGRGAAAFWSTVLAVIERAGVPTLSRIIGPMAAAELATTVSGFAPLLEALTSDDPGHRETAAKALQFVVMAVHAGTRPIVGVGAGPWADLAAASAAGADAPSMYPVAQLLQRAIVIDQSKALTPSERTQYGAAARALLQFAWSDTRYRSFVPLAITTVARTYDTDPAASRALLARILGPAQLKSVGYEELPPLVREVNRLIAIDPSFVTGVYRAAFGYEEESQQPTSFLGRSAILPLTSHRRQDYHGAWHELGRIYPAFLTANPQEATRALIDAVEACETRRARRVEPEETTFAVGDQTARVQTDYRYVLDSVGDDDVGSMLAAFEKAVVEASAKDTEIPRQMFDVLVKENRLAAIWSRFLFAAKQQPNELKTVILPLVTSPNVLLGDGICKAAIQVVPALLPHLTHAEQDAVEQAILAMPASAAPHAAEYATLLRDQLVKSLPRGHIGTQEMVVLRDALDAAAADRGESGDENAAAMQWLAQFRDAGMERLPPDVRALVGPLDEIATRFLNSAPAEEDIPGILKAADIATIFVMEHPDLDPAHRRRLESCIAATGRAIARNIGLKLDDPAYLHVRGILLAAADSTDPEPDADHEQQWDSQHQSFSQGARALAADGLISLADRAAAAKDDEVLAVIERLSADPVASVRTHIIANAQVLAKDALDLVWKILDRVRDEEPRVRIAAQSLGPLRALVHRDASRVVRHAIATFQRFSAPRPPELIAREVTYFLRNRIIFEDDPDARAWLDEILTAAQANPEVAGSAVHGIRDALMTDNGSPEEAAAVRARTFQLARDVLAPSARAFRAAVRRPESRTTPPADDEVKLLQEHARVIATVAREAQFACGKVDNDTRLTPEAAQHRAPIVKRFFAESRALIDDLIEVGHVRASHDVLKTVVEYIDLDPRGTFLRILTLLQRAAETGYQQEHEAMRVVVSIVERYLADYRDLLEGDDACRDAVVEILDLFIEAGWPEALRLAFRLGDLFS